jgi:enoyl-CoA hydratase/carnithine racemase
MDLLLTGATISADDAVAMGMASEAVDDDDLDRAVQDIVVVISGYDAEPVRTIKRLARAIESMSPSVAEAAGVDAVIARRLRSLGEKN